tara:strand:+ start:7062 stop:8339 length:1278 start_codon:yes stop_codon:yes gene_type:complete
MYKKNIMTLAKSLWPIHRTIVGPGFRESLSIIKFYQNLLKVKNIKTGTKVFDWKIPKEWQIKDAWIKYKKKKILDYKKNNLYVVGHSTNINKSINLNQLKKHLHYIKEIPNAIPYVTSYYKKYWGFCIEYKKFKNLKRGNYQIYIDSKLSKGNLSYGEIVLKGKTKKEILFTTYLCHPSMANNEISGPCVSTFLSNYVKNLKKRHYTYRFLFIPETIGSISYISKNLKHLKANLLAGFNISCVGDERNYSYISSRSGNTLADKVAKKTLNSLSLKFKKYDWMQRGSDERQFCSPGVDLPFCTLSRSKFGTYKEYHTSLDKIGNVLTKKGLNSSLRLFKEVVNFFETHEYYNSTYKCEPFMTKRNLYSHISKYEKTSNRDLMNVLSVCDGRTDLNEISKKCNIKKFTVVKILKILEKNKLIFKTKI